MRLRPTRLIETSRTSGGKSTPFGKRTACILLVSKTLVVAMGLCAIYLVCMARAAMQEFVQTNFVATGGIWWKPVVAKSDGKADVLRMLRPYWIKTNKPLSPGYGVTARTEQDARRSNSLRCPASAPSPRSKPVKDAASLDQGHVIPNMGNMLRRGIWYPLGYEHLTG